MRDIAYYERCGDSYVAFDASGKAVGIVTVTKRNVNARDNKKGLQRFVERQER